MIGVALLDDHASYRGALAFLLERDAELTVVWQAGTLAEARARLATAPVDVVLVDLTLPDGSGLDLLPTLHAHHPDAAAVVLTGSDRAESRALAVAAGAVGFLHKSVEVAAILEAIRCVAAGEMLFTAAEAVALMRQAMRYQADHRATQQALDQLTRRERDVLRALAAGLDNQAIADRLHLTTATTRTHVGQILRKLGVDSRLQAALIAVRHGEVDPDARP